MTDAPESAASAPVRDRLLDAAEQVVTRDGVRHLTLEAVAHEAGVSKGGLLYHFPAKSSLIAAIVERHAGQRESAQARAIAADSRGPGAFTRAYLSTRAAPPTPEKVSLHTAMLVAVGTEPQLLDPIRERCREWQTRLESDGIDPAIASIVRLAIDGICLCRLLGLPVPEGKLRQQVIDKLISMTEAQGP